MVIGILTIEYRVNGGAWTLYTTEPTVTSGFIEDISTDSLGNAGDDIDIRAGGSAIALCNDIVSNIVSAQIT